jgi:hypothetical protein
MPPGNCGGKRLESVRFVAEGAGAARDGGSVLPRRGGDRQLLAAESPHEAVCARENAGVGRWHIHCTS